MSFTLVVQNLDQSIGTNLYNIAIAYLRHSDLATFVIDSLDQAAEVVTIEIDPGDRVENR